MSSGQKECYNDAQEEYFDEHKKRLEDIGYNRITQILETITDSWKYFDNGELTLNRNQFAKLDGIKKELEKLK